MNLRHYFGPLLRSSERAPGGDLLAHADFEGGNAVGIEILSPGHLRFAARADTSPRPLWFYFCIEHARVPAVRCDLTNADQCLGPRLGWRTARPVFSADGRLWERVTRTEYVEQSDSSGYFSFTVPVVGPRTYVAYCYPYTTRELGAMLRSLPREPLARQEELCRTREDRPVPYIRLGNHESPGESVWIIARQHAGETPASFAVEGMLELLSGRGAAQPRSLADTAYHVVPLVDVDGVYHGRYGKDEAPVDFNRDWRAAPARPEIAALIQALHRDHHRRPIRLVLDLHAPHHGDTACYLFGCAKEDNPEVFLRQARLVRYLAEETPAGVGFRETDLRPGQCPERSARHYLWNTLRVHTLTLELSYHLAQSGEYLTPRHYRELGKAALRAVDRFLQESAPAA